MKLYQNTTSPFARKVRIVMDIVGLKENKDFTVVNVMPHDRSQELLKQNPLSRIPVLVLDNGSTIIDSKVIIKYLLRHYPNSKLVDLGSDDPSIETSRNLFIADGIIECGINCLLDKRRPLENQFQKWQNLMVEDIERCLNYLEKKALPGAELNLYSISLICALDFLNFRFPSLDWRKGCPKVSKWHENISHNPLLQSTLPHE